MLQLDLIVDVIATPSSLIVDYPLQLLQTLLQFKLFWRRKHRGSWRWRRGLATRELAYQRCGLIKNIDVLPAGLL